MRLAVCCAALALGPHIARAQLPIERLELVPGVGVDTTAQPVGEIFAVLRRYLTTGTDAGRAALWSRPERTRWPVFDLVGQAVYQGHSRFTVVELRPTVGLAGTFRVRILVAADHEGRPATPIMLYQLYAVHEDGAWVLANALPRLTRGRQRELVGAITFTFPRGHAFMRTDARSSARFVDSLANAFRLPRPGPIEYYLTDDLQETLRALGLEWYPFAPDSIGGRANAFNRQVFVGLPSHGEAYRHELAHVVLQPLIGLNTSGVLMEGVMTWAGGRATRVFRDLPRGLAEYLAAHPGLTLDTILRDPPERANGVDPAYDGLAVLCHMVAEAGGAAAVRTLLAAGREPNEVLNAAVDLLRMPRDRLEDRWRSVVADLARRR